jgi:hypothetical protein
MPYKDPAQQRAYLRNWRRQQRLRTAQLATPATIAHNNNVHICATGDASNDCAQHHRRAGWRRVVR